MIKYLILGVLLPVLIWAVIKYLPEIPSIWFRRWGLRHCWTLATWHDVDGVNKQLWTYFRDFCDVVDFYDVRKHHDLSSYLTNCDTRVAPNDQLLKLELVEKKIIGLGGGFQHFFLTPKGYHLARTGGLLSKCDNSKLQTIDKLA